MSHIRLKECPRPHCGGDLFLEHNNEDGWEWACFQCGHRQPLARNLKMCDDNQENPDYYKTYYIKNKERIAKQFKERYERVKADPVLLKEHQRQCKLAIQRYRERHPEKVKPQRRAAYLNRRRKLFTVLGGAICRNCGCTELEFLELNHINGGGSKEFKRIGNHLYELLLRGERSQEDYEVLCRVCNALDHLKRKNPGKAQGYSVAFTGKEATRLDDK